MTRYANIENGMKTAILAGGRGTRLSEETNLRPKPMVEIGEHPILWHILKLYAAHGHCELVIACGYKGEVIKSYFRNFFYQHSDLVVDLRPGTLDPVNHGAPPWRVSLVDTGLNTMTG